MATPPKFPFPVMPEMILSFAGDMAKSVANIDGDQSKLTKAEIDQVLNDFMPISPPTYQDAARHFLPELLGGRTESTYEEVVSSLREASTHIAGADANRNGNLEEAEIARLTGLTRGIVEMAKSTLRPFDFERELALARERGLTQLTDEDIASVRASQETLIQLVSDAPHDLPQLPKEQWPSFQAGRGFVSPDGTQLLQGPMNPNGITLMNPKTNQVFVVQAEPGGSFFRLPEFEAVRGPIQLPDSVKLPTPTSGLDSTLMALLLVRFSF
jgi:hypothetical protein